MSQLATALEETLGSNKVLNGQPLARYTSLRIGGPADLLIAVQSAGSLRLAAELAWDHGVPCWVLGSGSNVLVSDAGVRGLTILNRARDVVFSSDSVRAASGASLSTIARQSVTKGLAGLEWATGIPGTVGGAVVGNAGAWGGDVASTLRRATVLEQPGLTNEWPVARFGYGYRTSVLKYAARHGGQDKVILEVEFALQPAERKALEARVAKITSQRKASQPPGATCGSVFKNPPGDHAGRLIEAAGLKGIRQGQAEISPVHANFVVNRGDATAADVRVLIDRARQEVQTQFDIVLQPEIELVGDW
jgi:UDP-N-acetylmuramate dehydrogenase